MVEKYQPLWCVLSCLCGLCALIALGGVVDYPIESILSGVILAGLGTGFGRLGEMI